MNPLLSGVQEVLIYYIGHGGQEGDSLTVRITRVLIYYIGHGGLEGDSLTVKSTRGSNLLHWSRDNEAIIF